MIKNRWNPDQYNKFESERNQPFYDLLKLIHSQEAPHLLDLGCGDGKLTLAAHQKLRANLTLGIDISHEMLAKAQRLQTTNLFFREEDIQNFTSEQKFHIILSNAALQWVPDHQKLLTEFTLLLESGGQLAIQMPLNQNYPSHVLASELAAEEPYRSSIVQQQPATHVLEMEDYAVLLDELGFESQIVRTQIYVHYLESTASLVEWLRGSLLTYYQGQLTDELYKSFLAEYRKRVIERLGWSEPFFFPMKRLFIWGQLPIL
jgi:trans-aconitate 2-methyltransferase